jgi:hypothetical protein
VKGHELAALGIHRDPDPRLVGFFLHEASQCIGFHCQALDQAIVLTGDWLDMQMIRQRCKTLDQKTQEPLESDPHGAANAPQGQPLAQ